MFLAVLVFDCTQQEEQPERSIIQKGKPMVAIQKSTLKLIRNYKLDENKFKIGRIAPSINFVDHFGNLYINDIKNRIYLQYDSIGNLKKVIGIKGKGPGELTRPRYLFVDSQAHIYVFDMSKFSMVVYDTSNQFIEEVIFHQGNPVPGSFAVYDSMRIICLVENKGNNYFEKVHLFHFLDNSLKIIRSISIDYPKEYKELNLVNFIFPYWTIDKEFLYVVFPALPYIYKYNFTGEVLNRFEINTTNFVKVNKRIRKTTNLMEKKKLFSQFSHAPYLYLFKDEYLFFGYYNEDLPKNGKFPLQSGRTFRKYFYNICSTSGVEIRSDNSLLPGDPLFCTPNGLLYILLNDKPENREIGVYEIVLEKI
jgi:hypothetical protein